MSMPLMEKYRPRNLSDMVGQEQAVRVLRHDIREGTIAPLYIISGTFGTGKTTAARAFARECNCLGPGPDGACGRCANCRALDRGVAGFLTEINATENSSVDKIRELLSDLRIARQGKRRVVILDEAHHMSRQAMDTLLKVCEEPNPSHTFVMVTSERNRIGKALLTRAKAVRMQPIGEDVIVDRLRFIAGQESLDVDDGMLRSCAERAQGSMRQAINHLEQVIAGGGPGDGRDAWPGFWEAFTAGDVTAALLAVADLLDEDHTPQDVLGRLFAGVRSALLDGDRRWGADRARFALAELSRAALVMGGSGSDRVALEAVIVSVAHPPHRDVEALVRQAVERALEGLPQRVADAARAPAREVESPGRAGAPQDGGEGVPGSCGGDSGGDVFPPPVGDGVGEVMWPDAGGEGASGGAGEDTVAALRSSRDSMGCPEGSPGDEAVREFADGLRDLRAYGRTVQGRRQVRQMVDERGADEVARELVAAAGGVPSDPGGGPVYGCRDDIVASLRELKSREWPGGNAEHTDVSWALHSLFRNGHPDPDGGVTLVFAERIHPTTQDTIRRWLGVEVRFRFYGED